MNADQTPAVNAQVPPAAAAPSDAQRDPNAGLSLSPVAAPGVPPWFVAVVGVLMLLALAALGLAWFSQQRIKLLEQQLVARQQQTQTESGEALLLARQSQDTARESAARMALLEARMSEVAVQRTQLEELIQSLSRSRDENLLADLEAALRVAQQQSALTGSLEPLISTLRQADDRLARLNQPRLERVRRAVLRDLERVRGASQVDVATLVIRLDEVSRQIDDLPLAAVSRSLAPRAMQPAVAGSGPGPVSVPGGQAVAAGSAPTVPPEPADQSGGWQQGLMQAAQWSLQALSGVWSEVRSLVRITRIDNPEAVLAAPEQQFFLRENLKLRLLNARLALLSRQFDVAQSDLQDAQRSLERYFDQNSRRVGSSLELLRQVAQLSRQVSLPRPDETLSALASANTLR